MIHHTIRHLAVPIDHLSPFPGNPRRGDLDAIAASLTAYGQYRPIVARTGTNEILAGNHTWRAARQLGWPEIAATWVDVDADTARRIVAADNRLAELADYDDALLVELLEEISDLAGTGWSPDDLDQLLAPDPIALETADALGDTPDTGYREQYGVIVVCTDEAEQTRVYDRLTDDGYTCKVVVT